MDMRKVRMHQGCIGQENVAMGFDAPPAAKCRCKKLVDYAYANELIKTNQAKWVVVERKPVEVIGDCSFCAAMTDVEKKTCASCAGSGKVKVLIDSGPLAEKYNHDIVLMSQMSKDEKNKKYRRNTRAKTPRVATIEMKHITRAFVDELKYAVERIKEYEAMIQEDLVEFGAALREGIKDGKKGKTVVQGHPEPRDEVKSYPPGAITFSDGSTNKSWYWKVEGRRHDYGRAL